MAPTIRLLGAAWAFVRRGVATYVSYRAKMSLGFASLLLSAVTFACVGKVVARAGPGFVERYGTNYSSFVLLGVAVHTVATTGLGCSRAALRREQLQGTLEMLLTSGLPEPLLVLFSGLVELVVVAAGAGALVAVAAGVFGLEFNVAPAAVPAVLLYSLFMTGLGLASAGAILVTKEGEPVSWVFGAISGLLGGVYFPVDMLPSWLESFSRVLPTTLALSLVRPAMAGSPTPSGPHALLVLSLSALAALAFGILALRWCLLRARAGGTLGQY